MELVVVEVVEDDVEAEGFFDDGERMACERGECGVVDD